MKIQSIVITLIICLLVMQSTAQNQVNDLPFRSVPDYPVKYTAATTAARMIDGLGFRYYWATEGLNKDDLGHRPSEDARSSDETLNHILGLCSSISKVTIQSKGERYDYAAMTFDEKRRKTLELLKIASDYLKKAPDTDLETLVIKSGKRTYPYWNLINGQIADAIWHVGQVVTFRRSSGNPINSNVNFFAGVLNEE